LTFDLLFKNFNIGHIVVLTVESNTKLAAKAMKIHQESELTFKVCIPMKVSAKTAWVNKKMM
jgi:hypothetical protein